MKILILICCCCFLNSQENKTNSILKAGKEIIKRIDIKNNISIDIYKDNNKYMNKTSYNIKPNFKKNLIIVAIINYDWKKIELFFKSFQHSGFINCDLVVFYDDMSDYTINKIKSLGIIVYSIKEKYNQTFKGIPLINYRWKIYYDYLSENKDKYNLILTSDVRDSLFQLDVFKFYQKNQSFLGIAIEDGNLTEQFNSKWIINAYGERLYKNIEHERIICIGTLWGTLDKFIQFCDIIWDILGKNWALKHGVIEQGVVNYLIYYEKLFNECLVRSDNENGRVMTIGLTDRKNIFLDSQNNILNRKNQIAALVHQYDRKEDLVEIMRKKYGILYKSKHKNNSDLIYLYPQLISSIFIMFIIIILIIIGFIGFYKHKPIKTLKKIEEYKLNSSSIDLYNE